MSRIMSPSFLPWTMFICTRHIPRCLATLLSDQARQYRQQIHDLLSYARIDWLTSEVRKLMAGQASLSSTVEELRNQAERLGVLVDEMDQIMKRTRRFVGNRNSWEKPDIPLTA